MSIDYLDIHKLRNIEAATLKTDHCSLILGPNGSGKTSILEAIHLLSTGKSFRSSQIETVINQASSELIVHGVISGVKAGLQRFRNGKVSIRLDGSSVNKISEISRLLPVHIIEPNSVQLIEGGPGERRKFLDFAMFHVEHDYLDCFKVFNNALRQRNALLKRPNVKDNELRYWDTVYVDAAWKLNLKRKELYESVISPGFDMSISKMMGDLDISHSYEDGCKSVESQDDLAKKVTANRNIDIKFKATQIGPHRADILLKTKGKIAKDYLSRGQKKLLTYGVRLAPAIMLGRENKDKGVILIDDMPSELDEHSVRKVCNLLKDLEAQTVLTAVDGNSIQTEIIKEAMKPQMFHVEHGKVQRIES